MPPKLDEILQEAMVEVRRMKALNDEREAKAILEQRANLPKDYQGTAYIPQTRALDLKAEDKAFLDYVRHGANMSPDSQKALVENEVGQYLVSPVITTEIERVVEELVTVRRLASKRTVDKDRLQVRAMDEVTMAWGKLEVGHDITESNLTPSAPVYKYVEDLYGLSKIGEDELSDSDIELSNYLADSFGRAIAQTENLAFIAGTDHANNQPEGIITSAILKAATITTNASDALIVEEFLEMIYNVPAAYRKGSTFIVNSLTELALRKLRAKNGDATHEGPFLWQPSVQAGKPNTFLGYGIETDDNMPTIAADAIVAIFGNFQRGYKVIDRKGMSVQRLSELYAEAGLVGFKCHARVGGYLIKPSNAALVLLTMNSAA